MVKGTGVYFNESKQRYEAWAVNNRTQKKILLGWLTKECSDSHPDAYKLWDRSIWSALWELI